MAEQEKKKMGNPAWVKGVSGNPRGIPKAFYEFQTMARQHTELALKTLVEMAAKGKPDAVRVVASNHILNRAWGQPAPDKEPIAIGEAPVHFTLHIHGTGSKTIVAMGESVNGQKAIENGDGDGEDGPDN